MNTTFSKQHTTTAKGIAILLMLFHHLYILPERIYCEHASLLEIWMPGSLQAVATFCKLCVCIYAFLTGFGLYQQLKNKSLKEMYISIFNRAKKFWVVFLLIYILFVPWGFLTGYFTDIFSFLGGFLLISFGGFNNTWWYINAYLAMLFAAPLLVFLFNKATWRKRISYLLLLPAMYWLNRLMDWFLGDIWFPDNYIKYLGDNELMPVLFVGILCAKFQLYDKAIALFQRIHNGTVRSVALIVSSLAVLIVSIVFRVFVTRSIVDMRHDFIVAPLFVFSCTTLLYQLKCNRFFTWFGTHSTAIWLSHAFLCYTYFQKIVFLPYNSEMIFLWFAVLSMVTSYLIHLFLIPMNNRFFSKEKAWSLKGYPLLW